MPGFGAVLERLPGTKTVLTVLWSAHPRVVVVENRCGAADAQQVYNDLRIFEATFIDRPEIVATQEVAETGERRILLEDAVVCRADGTPLELAGLEVLSR